jgi:hypothetical protein
MQFSQSTGYDSMTLAELAENLQVSKEKMLRVSKKEGVNLPFGMDTVLHLSLVDKVRSSIVYDQYDDPEFPGLGIIDVESEYKNEEDDSDDDDRFIIGGSN